MNQRPLNSAEIAHIEDVLARLREHFHQWPGYEGAEQELVQRAFYEECGENECCSEILAEAAPIALGTELVKKHGFDWVVLSIDDARVLGVTHPALNSPINLYALEYGSYVDEDGQIRPAPGKITSESLEYILDRVREASKER